MVSMMSMNLFLIKHLSPSSQHIPIRSNNVENTDAVLGRELTGIMLGETTRRLQSPTIIREQDIHSYKHSNKQRLLNILQKRRHEQVIIGHVVPTYRARRKGRNIMRKRKAYRRTAWCTCFPWLQSRIHSLRREK